MAFDAFIKIEGIPGEALDEQHKDWIEITGYSFGTHHGTSATASSAGGASSGRTTVSDFKITKNLDKSSCKLIEAITLEEVIVSSYAQTANDGVPTESISLNCGRIKTFYTQQKMNVWSPNPS